MLVVSQVSSNPVYSRKAKSRETKSSLSSWYLSEESYWFLRYERELKKGLHCNGVGTGYVSKKRNGFQRKRYKTLRRK